MEVYREIAPLQHFLNQHKFRGRKIGLVPTMGALHDGHLSLLKAAQRENDLTICSIYVNPAQFNNNQDLQKYPRRTRQDLALLETAGCDAVFCPSDNVVYQQQPKIRFDFAGLDKVMEGKFRPGHFNGVGIVVCKLFNIIAPDNAYFGQKDLQQFLIIRQLILDLSFNINPRCMPIIREQDGLAMSSRNKRLTPQGRSKAPVLYQALCHAKDLIVKKERLPVVKQEVVALFKQAGVQLEYFEVVDPDTLSITENISSQKNVALCVASYIGDIRLIDNIIFNLDHPDQ